MQDASNGVYFDSIGMAKVWNEMTFGSAPDRFFQYDPATRATVDGIRTVEAGQNGDFKLDDGSAVVYSAFYVGGLQPGEKSPTERIRNLHREGLLKIRK